MYVIVSRLPAFDWRVAHHRAAKRNMVLSTGKVVAINRDSRGAVRLKIVFNDTNIDAQFVPVERNRSVYVRLPKGVPHTSDTTRPP